MLSSIRSPFTALIRPVASSSRVVASALSAAPFTPSSSTSPPSPSAFSFAQIRFKSNLAPRRIKYKKSQKGRPSGGSIKGSTLQHGGFGLRILSASRITASQLSSAQTAVKRKIKPVKGAECHLRVFPDVPVCVKGNETRMGKGKGSFEYWACRVPAGRVVFEVSGGGIREEIARQALKLAQVKLPVPSEFITVSSPPRLGSIASHDLSPPPSALPIPAQLAQLDAKGEGRAVGVVLAREERLLDELTSSVEGLNLGSPGVVTGGASSTEARA